jgi:predicted acyltransferase
MLFVPLGSPINASLYYAFAWVLCFYLLAYVMYRKGWFLKV